MDDFLNPPKVYTDVGFTVAGASKEELVNYLIKYNQEASARVDADGETSFDFLDESKRNRIRKGDVGHNSPHVIGIPITFREGDRVKTKDGRVGTVLGNSWVDELVLYRYESEPRSGYFLVKVDFGEHIEYHIRNDLSGDRFRPL